MIYQKKNGKVWYGVLAMRHLMNYALSGLRTMRQYEVKTLYSQRVDGVLEQVCDTQVFNLRNLWIP